MWSLKILSIILVLVVTLMAASYPFFRRLSSKQGREFPIGESLAAGVFLGAGLMHMLAEASQEFYQQHIHYPLAFLLAGTTFLLLLLLEHIGRELYVQPAAKGRMFAVLAVCLLSIHSFLAGSALGLTTTASMTILILLAILAHKWAASFALAVEINKSDWGFKSRLLLFAFFALMVPLGIVCGTVVSDSLNHYSLLEPIFNALAAGTFLYLGTLHGLERATLIKHCCDLKRFNFVIVGFLIMAIVAVWA